MRIALAVLLAACSSSAPPPPALMPSEHWAGSLSPAPAEGAEVVATVNGDRVYLADVEIQARAAGTSAAQALDELVKATLLAQEAQRRGLADDPDVAEARRRAAVRVLLARGFEPSFAGPEAVPQDEVDAIYRMPSVRAYYDHEEYHTCAWVRIEVKAGAPPAEDVRAHALADALYAAEVAAHPASKEEFFAAARPFGAKSEPNQVYSTTRSNGPAVPEFAAAAYSISTPGQIAAPARTKWGWDVLYLDGIIPERHAPRAEVDADIRKQRFEVARRAAFQRWVEQLTAGHQIAKNEQRLDAVQVDSLVGMP